MKAIMIQPALRAVYETNFDEKSDNINFLLNALVVHAVPFDEAGNYLCYGDNGDLLKPTEPLLMGSDPQPYFGMVLILGPADANGHKTDTTLSLDDVEEMVRWL